MSDFQPAISCVIVHHLNLGGLRSSIDLLVQEGISRSDIVVVDNSGPELEDHDLALATGENVTVERIPNNGYGNAANHGIEVLLGREGTPRYILIATHEVKPLPGAVAELSRELEDNRFRLAVGPRLISTLPDGGVIESTGGYRTRFFGIPRHHEHISPEYHEQDSQNGVKDRLWLDGAFVLYRASALASRRFREEFFLYYEETEFHYRLSEKAGAVACVPSAVVEEESRGPAPELRGRNQQWLLQLHGRWWQRLFTLPWIIARDGVKVLLGKADSRQPGAVARGWRFARRNPLRPSPEPFDPASENRVPTPPVAYRVDPGA